MISIAAQIASAVAKQVFLLPVPTSPSDTPLWSEPKLRRDQFAAVDNALCSILHQYAGQPVTANPMHRSSDSTRVAY